MWITTMVSAWDFPSNQSILLGFWRCWIAHWLDGATKIPSPDTKSLEFQIVIIYPYISHDSPKRYPCYHGGLKKIHWCNPVLSSFDVPVKLSLCLHDHDRSTGRPKGCVVKHEALESACGLFGGLKKPEKNMVISWRFFHEKYGWFVF